MSDAVILIKDPTEILKDFNKRLRTFCGQTAVTDFEVHVVDGQPMVSLFAGMVPAEEEDVEDAKEAGEIIKVGDLIPEDDPIVVQVCGVAARAPMERDENGGQVKGKEGDAAQSEKRLDALCEKAADGIVKMRVASGTSHDWVTIPGKDANKREWLPVTKTYVALAFGAPDEAADATAPAAPAAPV